MGAIYEIGALCALDETLVGVDFNRLTGYVGVSAGSFIAAGLANGITPRELYRSFIEDDAEAGELFSASLLMRPAWREFGRRAAALPALAARAALQLVLHPRSPLSAVERLGSAIPSGLFSGEPMQAQLQRLFTKPGRSNDFRTLKHKLVIVATDLDSGGSAPFGLPGWDHVPISRAAQASAALPGLYPPVEIDGRHFVDGALKKTLHASVLLDEGIDLLICLNPLVPFEATPDRRSASPADGGSDGGAGSTRAPRHAPLSSTDERIPRLVDGGLPVVLSQTFRSLIHSRLELGMRGYRASHPGVDIVLFEPDPRDTRLFLANTFGISQRHALAEHAYQCTRKALRARRAALAAQLAPHGVSLDHAVLDERERSLGGQALSPRARTARALRHLDDVLTDLELGLGSGGVGFRAGRAPS